MDSAVTDEWNRIFRGCETKPLFRVMRKLVEVGIPYAESGGHELNTTLGESGVWGQRSLDDVDRLVTHFDLLYDITRLQDIIGEQYDAVFGPRLSTIAAGKPEISMDVGHILTFDFDQGDDFGDQQLHLREGFEWNESGFSRAAIAYRHCCGWDFTPDEAGIWLCYYLLTDAHGSRRRMWFNGNLIGFVILYDRNEDGNYESLGHIWTAEAARRKGVARQLVKYAREHFPIQRVEGPLTDSGRSLIENVWPESLQREKEKQP